MPRRPTAGRRPGARPARTPRVVPPPAARAPAVAGRAPERPAGAARRGLLGPRAAVLALVVCGLLLSAALPLREHLSQRDEITRLEGQQQQALERVAALETERDRLQDPAYVASEARRRLHFVLPGETAYVVLVPEETEPAAEGPVGSQAPWYSQVWGSVQQADRPPPPPPS